MTKFQKANSHEIIRYKQAAISLIVNDDEIVKIIDNSSATYGSDLIYENIFPYMKLPATEQEQKTYILLYIDMPDNSNQNNLMKDLFITFVVATHQDLMKVNDAVGTRVDLLSHLIDVAFNGSDAFGLGSLKLISNLEGSLDQTHPCRTLKFKATNFDNKNKATPRPVTNQ